MGDFSGTEPLVGEIRGLRTFRIDDTGTLLPLYSAGAWYEGDNLAVCSPPIAPFRSAAHAVPGDDCECGYYAYGSVEASARQRQSRFVLAVVACWGNVVAGTLGVRAEHARIEAIWLAPSAPDWLRRRLGVRYPSVRLFAAQDAMLTEFPPTELPCYQHPTPPTRATHARRAALGLAAAVLLGLGVLPLEVLRGTDLLRDVWLLGIAVAVAATVWLAAGVRWAGHVTAALVVSGLVAWLVAPLFGLSGWLLRAPLLRGALVALWGLLLSLDRRRFPLVPTPRERTFCGVRASG